jgi:hypothetical protein
MIQRSGQRDVGFPLRQLVLARLAGRQLPDIAHAFAEHIGRVLAVETVSKN